MRKTFAILMIAIHLFNLAGYNLLFGYYVLRSDKTLVERLDKNQYKDSELIEVKVKLNMPYMTVLGNYERFDGEITLNGEYYKYVKRRISNDTLYMLCLPDYYKSELSKGKTEYASKANELQSGNSKKDGTASSLKKGVFTGEYGCQMKSDDIAVYPTLINEFESFISIRLTDICIDAAGQPPELKA